MAYQKLDHSGQEDSRSSFAKIDAMFADLFGQAGAGNDQYFTVKESIHAPILADLVSIVAAVTPANVALTLAAQPPHARKLSVRIVIGTTTTTAITAGTLTLVGTDQDGSPVSEVISLIENASATVKSKWAYAQLTSATVAGYAANGSGTGNTVGIGVAADFGISTGRGAVTNFTCIKETKITNVEGTSQTAADEAIASVVTDAVARTVAPVTAASATGLIDYEITCSYTEA